MQREFGVRVAARSDVASASPPDGGVREKVDYALAVSRRGMQRAEQRRLVTRTIETLRGAGRARSIAARRPPSGER
jgi:hypothetical protein